MAEAPWRQFEKEVAGFLGRAGFQVTLNARAAHPRQTDAYAHDDKLRLLIEAKNRKRRIDVGDIDALRSRLGRTKPDNIGIIFSTSGLTAGAKTAIETDRRQEILTFTGQEIEQLRRGTQNMRALIEQKRESLAVNGKVWQSPGPRSRHRSVPLPPTALEFWVDNKPEPYFESGSRLSGASFALSLADTGWGLAHGEGVRLDIQMALSDINELRDLLGYLHKMFGLSKNGMFFIHQSQTAWHGAGAQNFVDAVEAWRERYQASAAKNFHHSEEFSYFDSFHTGWVQISAQQRVFWQEAARVSLLHHAEIVIQLPGIPVDASRFLRLCQYVNNDWAHFEYLGPRGTTSRRLNKPARLDVVGTVITADPDNEEGPQARTVVGIIARNPFYKKARLPKELINPDMPSLHSLLESELLLCDLRDWHEEGRRADYYVLDGFEIIEGGRGAIMRPFGTWNELNKIRSRRAPILKGKGAKY